MKEVAMAYRITFVNPSPLQTMGRTVAVNAIIVTQTERNNKIKPIAKLLVREWLKSTNRNGKEVIA